MISIPRYVDSQYQVFFWEADEVIPLLLFFGLGIFFDALALFCLMGVVMSHLFSRYKSRHLEGVLVHMSYFGGIAPLNQRFANGLVRDYQA